MDNLEAATCAARHGFTGEEPDVTAVWVGTDKAAAAAASEARNARERIAAFIDDIVEVIGGKPGQYTFAAEGTVGFSGSEVPDGLRRCPWREGVVEPDWDSDSESAAAAAIIWKRHRRCGPRPIGGHDSLDAVPVSASGGSRVRSAVEHAGPVPWLSIDYPRSALHRAGRDESVDTSLWTPVDLDVYAAAVAAAAEN